MPISLRLPADVETQIASFGARLGLSKSAVIVRSIQEFLAAHAHPTSLQIYEEAMRNAQDGNRVTERDAERETAEQRPHKRQARTAIARKHAQRSKAAVQAQTQQGRATGEST